MNLLGILNNIFGDFIFFMEVNLSECFSEAITEVLSKLCQYKDVVITSPEKTTFSSVKEDLAIFLDVSGKLRGSLIYSMSDKFAIELSSLMIGFPVSEINDLPKSSLAEVGNIISGKAMTKLSEKGYYCETTIPIVLKKEAKIPFKNPVGISFKVETPIGDLFVGISLRE